MQQTWRAASKIQKIMATVKINKKFWEELMCLLSLHKLTVDNIQSHHLHTKFHPNPPIGSKVARTSEG
jgi:hypothetical protein